MLKLNWIQSMKVPEHRFAWMVAIGVDALQIVFSPLFAPGFASPFDATLDVAAALLLTRALGWHWAFVPTFLAELIPGVDMIPTWTAAVWFVTRQRTRVAKGEGEILPPDPASVQRNSF